jgi:hypothetical protein
LKAFETVDKLKAVETAHAYDIKANTPVRTADKISEICADASLCPEVR